MLTYFKNYCGMVISIVMSLILSFSMACVALFRNAAAGFAIEALIRNWGTAFLTIMIVSLLFPVKEWGDRFAGACGLKPGTLPFGLASNLAPTLFFNTFITMVVAGVNVPGGFVSSLYWTAVANDFLPMFAVSYLLSLGAEKIGLSVAKKACAGGAEQLHL